MRRLAAAGGGALLGGVVGGLLPWAFFRHIDPDGLTLLQLHGAGTLALLGWVLGLRLAVGKRARPPRRDASRNGEAGHVDSPRTPRGHSPEPPKKLSVHQPRKVE